jgi:hypothetical protein
VSGLVSVVLVYESFFKDDAVVEQRATNGFMGGQKALKHLIFLEKS